MAWMATFWALLRMELQASWTMCSLERGVVNMPLVPTEATATLPRASAPAMEDLWTATVLVDQAPLVTVGTVCTSLTIIPSTPPLPSTMTPSPTLTQPGSPRTVPLRMVLFAVEMALVLKRLVSVHALMATVSDTVINCQLVVIFLCL